MCPSQPKLVCVCLRFFCMCVCLVCLQPGQCHSKPRVCHRQCQASQRDPATQRGLRGLTDPPPALPCSPSGQRPAGPIDPPALPLPIPMKNSLAPQPAKPPFLAPVLPDHHCDPRKGLPTAFCMPIDGVGVQGGVGGGCSFEITDNYKGPLLTGPCQYKFPLLISN